MDFQTSVRTCFQNYVTFSGRAIRSEYWWFTLFIIIASIVLGLVDGAVFGWGNLFSPLSDLFSLATILPSLAVTSRRLHDIDKSAWWMLLILVPLIGWIVLIYWMCQPGTQGPNQFGNDPFGNDPVGADDGDYAPSSIPNVGD
ncbi:DUF805 domain-containing protein [Aliiroseovarius marinus]|uniref:DUF805 domain-containing protein n=1 Tax=Aliiroseovarius marinus TaxID=2500159 RepID=UPI003D7E36DD